MLHSNLLVFFLNIFIALWFKVGIVEGIIGGHDAIRGQFKYQLSLQNANVHVCGASIIGLQHALTAAHCLIDGDLEFKQIDWWIVGGVIDINEEGRYRIEIPVEKLYVPSEFMHIDFASSNGRSTADIAVLKLKNRLKLNDGLSILNLPQMFSNSLLENSEPMISGFGLNDLQKLKDQSGRWSLKPCSTCTKMKFGGTRIIPNSRCQLMYPNPIRYHHICARLNQQSLNPEGVCQGDSGGPLVLNGDTIIGVLSSSPINCDEKLKAAVYTKVDFYLPFVNLALEDKRIPEIRTATYSINRNRRFLEEI